MNIVTMTKHNTTVRLKDGRILEFPSCGNIRVATSTPIVGYAGDVPIHKMTFGQSVLPERIDGQYIVVSSVVKMCNPQRDDLVVPFNVHYENGKPIYCEGLCL